MPLSPPLTPHTSTSPAAQDPPVAKDSTPFRAGFVALCGRPNVGKSTLLNQILGQHLSIVSPKPQTTRDRILGVLHLPTAQVALVDTPGLHLTSLKGRTALNRFMMEEAQQAIDGVELVVFLVQPQKSAPVKPPHTTTSKKPTEKLPPALASADEQIAQQLAGLSKKLLVAINKTDLLGDKRQLLPLIEALSKKLPGVPVVPISAQTGDGVNRLVQEMVAFLPPSDRLFEKDLLTDRPERFLLAEFVREQVFLATEKEIPYSVAVTVDKWEEKIAQRGPQKGQRLSISTDATIHVEKPGQKKILVGEHGQMIRDIGIRARQKASELLGCPAHLFLFVRVDESWSQTPAGLRNMGYEQDRLLTKPDEKRKPKTNAKRKPKTDGKRVAKTESQPESPR